MVIHIDLLLYTFTTCSYFYFFGNITPDLPRISLVSSSSECIVSPSIESESTWSPISSNILSSVLLLGLCYCLCSVLLLLVSLALVFPSLTQDQLAKSFLDLFGARIPFICLHPICWCN